MRARGGEKKPGGAAKGLIWGRCQAWIIPRLNFPAIRLKLCGVQGSDSLGSCKRKSLRASATQGRIQPCDFSSRDRPGHSMR